jgi:hypothetical protein
MIAPDEMRIKWLMPENSRALNPEFEKLINPMMVDNTYMICKKVSA